MAREIKDDHFRLAALLAFCVSAIATWMAWALSGAGMTLAHDVRRRGSPGAHAWVPSTIENWTAASNVANWCLPRASLSPWLTGALTLVALLLWRSPPA